MTTQDPDSGPEPSWAQAVYVDSSSLRRVPPDLSHPDVARLNDVLEKLGVEKFLPAVVRDEWVVAQQVNARKKRQEMISAARAVENYLGLQIRPDVPDPDSLDREVERVQMARLRSAGFIEIPTPDANISELLQDAVRWVKPFGENDKGFRDAMIVRAIAAHAAQFTGFEILIISADDVFRHPDVLTQWKAVGVTPTVVRDFREAAASLDAGLDHLVREQLEYETEKVEAFLKTRKDEIFARLLQDVEVTESFIKGGPLQKQAYYGTLERVRAVRPLDIGYVSLGHALRGKVHRDGRRRPVTFFVNVAFDITVREFPLSALFSSGPKFRLDVVDHEVQVANPFEQPQQMSHDLEVERDIIVEAWVIEDEENTGQLIGLEIEKINTW